MFKSLVMIAVILCAAIGVAYILWRIALDTRRHEDNAIRDDAQLLRDTEEALKDLDYARERRQARHKKWGHRARSEGEK